MFLGLGALAVGSVGCKQQPIEAAPLPPLPTEPPVPGGVPRRALGSTGAQVSVLGLGGFHIGKANDLEEAKRIVSEALDAGVNFFDNAWEYNDGRSEDWLGKALAGKRQHAFLMTKVCTHGRDHLVAQQQLEDSLRRLGTDYLDLWQVHECVYDNDPELHFAPDGVIRALEDAKKAGKVRFVGFTGHKHPRIHQKMLSHGFAFDTVQMPLNVFDANFRSFEHEVLPLAVQNKMGVIGMKSLGGTGQAIIEGAVTIEEALRYAMSVDGVSVTVSGVDSIAILRQNLAIARNFKALTGAEMQALRARTADAAGDGHFELYKTTTRFDAKVGREQHGYPSEEELPL
jgi:aryl-alcohol dehydrogenase-like predicted oxidoreductase